LLARVASLGARQVSQPFGGILPDRDRESPRAFHGDNGRRSDRQLMRPESAT
jgi:hypothetical protein